MTWVKALGAFAILVFLSGFEEARAQGFFVAVESTSTAVTTAPTTSFTFTHTVGSEGINRLLVVGLSVRMQGGGVVPVISMVVTGPSGVPRPANQQVGNSSSIPDLRALLFYLVNPEVGVNSITVTVDNEVASTMVAGSLSLTGVHQTAPIASSAANNSVTNDASPTVTVSTATGHLVVDTLAVRAEVVTAPPVVGPGQTQRWNAVSTVTGLHVRGSGSTEPGSPGAATMSWTLNNVEDWTIVGMSVRPAIVSEVGLTDFGAASYRGGTLLRWTSGYEVDNLGYTVYREEGGMRVPITRGLVAGSALSTGAKLEAGYSYSRWDAESGADTRYWLEDVDLGGKRTMHGPIVPVRMEGRVPAWRNSPLLADVNKGRADSSVTFVPGGLASLAKVSPGQTEAQRLIAARPAVKLSVREQGWYSVTQPELLQAGLDASVDPRLLQLFVDGQEQQILVTGEGDGRLDPTDAVEFYGTGLDVPSTDTRVYWLVAGNSEGRRVGLAPGGAAPGVAQSFLSTVERKERSVYFAALSNGEAENFFGAVVDAQTVNQPLTINQVDPRGSVARLEVALQGATDAQHRVSVQLNGVYVGAIVYQGKTRRAATFLVRRSVLREGENVVALVSQGTDPAGRPDVNLVDSIRVTYLRRAVADQDALRATVRGRRPALIGGFTTPQIRVVDITQPDAVTELAGTVAQLDSGYAVTVTAPAAASRTLLAFTSDQIKRPVGIVANDPSSWHARTQGADVVMLTHRDFADSAAPLRDLREGQGFRVAVVDVEDVYDEFSFGAKAPQAIKDFLSLARAEWLQAPRFVVFIGDASYDPRDYLGIGSVDFVPSKLVDTETLEAVSDDWFADFDGDDVPDMAVGRLPVRTAAEAATVVGKIVGYEQSGGWGREALFVADRNDGENFGVATASVRALLPSDVAVQEVSRQTLPDETARQEILAAINGGVGLVNYAGHGSVDIWRGNLLTADDANALTNGQQLAFFTITTCLNNYFHDPSLDGLGEALLRAGNGGAIAVWASSGTTSPAGQAQINEEMYRLLFGGESLTLGQAAARAKMAASGDVRRTWVFLGDPMTRLR